MGKDFHAGDNRPAETQYNSSADDSDNLASDASKDSLLDEVLQNTIPTESAPLLPSELTALQDVARQFVDREFSIEPAGIALVESLLRLRLPSGIREWTPEMARQIAEAIFDAPEARNRLGNLWDQLCESVK